MLRQVFKTAALVLLATASGAYAYQLTTPFQTDHFAINQVILDESEEFNEGLQQIIANDVTTMSQDGCKFQTVTAVFPHRSNGLSGSISEQMYGLHTFSNYGTGKAVEDFNTKSTRATDVGIYMSIKQLSDMVDNRATNKLLNELARLPLIITDFEVTAKTYDFQENLFFTFKNKALVLDFNAVDSLYYTKEQLREVKPGCKLTIMSLTDRALTVGAPIFISFHGAVNNINCKK